ncbi:MAG: hypothetical protein QOK16_1071, partial [Solirubrobacteraceae bacterium]|nr:hypothetical protein [Solirubrobacteraceae bacterium]
DGQRLTRCQRFMRPGARPHEPIRSRTPTPDQGDRIPACRSVSGSAWARPQGTPAPPWHPLKVVVHSASEPGAAPFTKRQPPPAALGSCVPYDPSELKSRSGASYGRPATPPTRSSRSSLGALQPRFRRPRESVPIRRFQRCRTGPSRGPWCLQLRTDRVLRARGDLVRTYQTLASNSRRSSGANRGSQLSVVRFGGLRCLLRRERTGCGIGEPRGAYRVQISHRRLEVCVADTSLTVTGSSTRVRRVPAVWRRSWNRSGGSAALSPAAR